MRRDLKLALAFWIAAGALAPVVQAAQSTAQWAPSRTAPVDLARSPAQVPLDRLRVSYASLTIEPAGGARRDDRPASALGTTAEGSTTTPALAGRRSINPGRQDRLPRPTRTPQPDSGGAASTRPSASRPDSSPESPSGEPRPGHGGGLRALTKEQARALFIKMGEKAAKDGFTPDHTWDGCWWKAREFEMAAVEAGVSKDALKRIHLVPGRNSGISWNYHTAVVIPVLDDNGRPQEMVFDPSLFGRQGPVSVNSYSRSMMKSFVRDDQAKVKKGQAANNTVSVVENSLDRPSHIFPPGWGYPDSEETVRSARASAVRMWARDYSDRSRRYIWRNNPSPTA